MAGERFTFKSEKGSAVTVQYEPSSAVKLTDKGAFEKYLKKIVDFIEVDDKAKAKKADKPKDIEAVAEEGEEKTDETEQAQP